MKKILVTGGTVFVSRRVAEWFKNLGNEVYVLNRGTGQQVQGVNHICADRNNLGGILKNYYFDAVLDIFAYTGKDIENLLDALGGFKDYVFLSSSAVYPETNSRPFKETQPVGKNKFWGIYGTNKIEAENYLISHVQNAYILRPPYIYGEGQNIYREPFIFDCAMLGRKFYVPDDGTMKLQFVNVSDICRFINLLITEHPQNRVFNVGGEILDINSYVALCYAVAGKKLDVVYVKEPSNYRDYFPYDNYEYALDLSEQNRLMPNHVLMKDSLKAEFEWYCKHSGEVRKKDYIKFIEENFEKE